MITASEGISAVTNLLALEIPTVKQQPILPRAYSLARLFDRTVYDALYLAVAEEIGAKFITADLRLCNAVNSSLGFVQYLDTYKSLEAEH